MNWLDETYQKVRALSPRAFFEQLRTLMQFLVRQLGTFDDIYA